MGSKSNNLFPQIEEGLLLINGKDAYKEFGAFLAEDKPGEFYNYAELMRPADAKSISEVSFIEQDGVKLPTTMPRALNARDLNLKFAIVAPDRETFFAQYRAFVSMLRGAQGWVTIFLKEIGRSYRLIYLSCSEWRQMTDFGDRVAARVVVKFREPQPSY